MTDQEIRYGTYTNSFDVSIAVHFMDSDYAVIYNHIYRWLLHNKSCDKNFIDNRTWTYQTITEIAKNLPFLSEKKVKICLQRLTEEGFLIRECLSKNPFDRTSWYALPDESMLEFKKVFTKGPKRALAQGNNGPIQKDETDPCIYTSREPSREHIETYVPSSSVENPSFFSEENNDSNENIQMPEKRTETPLESTITLQDVYSLAVTQKTDWQASEIETAWKIFSKNNVSINNPHHYFDKIIKNLRNKKIYTKPKIMIQMPKQEDLEKDKPNLVNFEQYEKELKAKKAKEKLNDTK